MKKISVLAMLLLLLFSVKSIAQDVIPDIPAAPIYIRVNETMAVNLIFPVPIKKAQWVSKSLSVQPFNGVNNILLIKANSKGIEKSNISVVTEDGRFYSFIIDYATELAVLNYNIPPAVGKGRAIILDKISSTVQIQRTADSVSLIKNTKALASGSLDDISLDLNGIYFKDRLLYYNFTLVNRSELPYEIDHFRFFISDRKKAKRTSAQEVEITPVLVAHNNFVASYNSKIKMGYVLNGFNIPADKVLTIQMLEKNGARHVSLMLKNKVLNRVKTIK